METFLEDLCHGLRSLRRAPGFTLVAVLTLAVGIAATTLVFSVVNAVLLERLPFPHPERLVMVWGSAPQVPRTPLSVPNFLDYRRRTTAFRSMAAFTGGGGILGGSAEPERVRVGRASSGLFAVLGVGPFLGRGFRPEEERPGRGRVAVLSYGLWQRRFAGRRDVVGAALRVGSQSYTVVGVLPASFRFAVPGYFRAVDLWTPLELTAGALRGTNFLRVVARLRPGVGLEQARQDLALVSADLAHRYPQADGGAGAYPVTLREQLVGGVRPALVALFGAVVAVLLVACANVAGLGLERAFLGRHRAAVRRALGASGGRLARALLTESALVGTAGGAVGMALAIAGMGLLERASTGRLPLTVAQLLDPLVVGFCLAMGLTAGLASGLAQLLRRRPPSLARALAEGDRSGGAGSGRLRDALVVAELAFSLALATGAGLFIESFVHLLHVPPGFDAAGVLVAPLSLPSDDYPDAARRLAYFRGAVERASALPGVEAAGGIDDLPLGSDRDADGFEIEDRPAPGRAELPVAQVRAVTPGTFALLRVPLIAGRAFTAADREAAAPVAIINRTLAERFFPRRDAVGRRLRLGGGSAPWRTIVGVVGDVRDLSLETAPEPEVYRPFAQAPVPYMALLLRTSVRPETLIPGLRKELRALDRALPAVAPTELGEVVAGARADRRFDTLLVSVFAVLALLLAAVGMYGVISFWARQRRREIGVRMALGARRTAVAGLVLSRGGRLAALSLALGAALSLGLERLLASLLFAARASDPALLAGVGALYAAVALVATWLPARRAARADPAVILRGR